MMCDELILEYAFVSFAASWHARMVESLGLVNGDMFLIDLP